jgi:cobalt-zinc-cadmium efflux system protein
LAVNLMGAAALYPARDQGINLRSAFLHLAADSLGSLAAIAAALAMLLKGWYWFDPLAGALVAVLIILGSWQLVFEAADILMEATPRHLDLAEVEAALSRHPGVVEVHDLHIWTIATGLHALSAHLVVDGSHDRDCLTWEVEEVLRHRFGLEHTTLQLEGPEYHSSRACTLSFPGVHL